MQNAAPYFFNKIPSAAGSHVMSCGEGCFILVYLPASLKQCAYFVFTVFTFDQLE